MSSIRDVAQQRARRRPPVEPAAEPAAERDGDAVADAVPDKRRQRGDRTRQVVLRAAVDLASTDGLEGLSFGRLADETGMSKAGIQTLLRTKETLQLATVDRAHELFEEAVVRPASALAPGAARVRALVDRWIDYAAAPLFPGGCFWGAVRPEQDSRPGPVRDALVRQHRAWVSLLAAELTRAAEAGEIAAAEADLVAFQLDALLTATNLALRVGETDAVDKLRRSVDALVA